MAAKETPAELFKRALAQSTRALAGAEEELEVTFGAEGPRLAPGKIVLPHPPRVISDTGSRALRGQADALALRLAHHDERAHARMRPQGAEARAVFDAVEEMRVQALGANAMKGVANNLTAALTDQLRTQRRRAHAGSRRRAACRCAGADRARAAHRPGAAGRTRKASSISGAKRHRAQRGRRARSR